MKWLGRLLTLAAAVLLLVVAGLAVDRLTSGPGGSIYCGRFVGVVAERHDHSGPPCDGVRAQRLRLMSLLGGSAVLLAVGGRWIARRYRDPSESYRRY